MDRKEARLAEFNGIMKENDELYRNAAKGLGLSDCAFWILYCLRDSGSPPTQSEICAALYQPKQTVNSAIKKLESDGLLELFPGQDNRSKQLHLTGAGECLAARTVDRVRAAEAAALDGLTSEELENFLTLFHRFTELLKREVAGIL